MTDVTTDVIYSDPPERPVRPELLISAALHLMSHYAATKRQEHACVRLAAVIERHLQALSELPGLAPVLQATCGQLSEQWAAMVEHELAPSVQAAQRPTLFRRMVNPVLR